jgi:hypothetical protein
MLMETFYGTGEQVRLKNGALAVRLHVPCAAKGCRNSKVVYVNASMYGYNIYGKLICNLRDEVYKCRKHRMNQGER